MHHAMKYQIYFTPNYDSARKSATEEDHAVNKDGNLKEKRRKLDREVGRPTRGTTLGYTKWGTQTVICNKIRNQALRVQHQREDSCNLEQVMPKLILPDPHVDTISVKATAEEAIRRARKLSR